MRSTYGLRPGQEIMKLHHWFADFMNWKGPIYLIQAVSKYSA